MEVRRSEQQRRCGQETIYAVQEEPQHQLDGIDRQRCRRWEYTQHQDRIPRAKRFHIQDMEQLLVHLRPVSQRDGDPERYAEGRRHRIEQDKIKQRSHSHPDALRCPPDPAAAHPRHDLHAVPVQVMERVVERQKGTEQEEDHPGCREDERIPVLRRVRLLPLEIADQQVPHRKLRVGEVSEHPHIIRVQFCAEEQPQHSRPQADIPAGSQTVLYVVPDQLIKIQNVSAHTTSPPLS